MSESIPKATWNAEPRAQDEFQVLFFHLLLPDVTPPYFTKQHDREHLQGLECPSTAQPNKQILTASNKVGPLYPL